MKAKRMILSALSVLLFQVSCASIPAPEPELSAPQTPPPEQPKSEEIPETALLPGWRPDADPQRYEGPVLDLEAKYAPGTFPVKPVLFVGSSTFTKWTSLEGLWPEHRVINRGFGGSQMSDLLYYFHRLVVAADPRQIVVYEGDNDIDAGKPADQVKAHFRQFGDLVKSRLPGVPVIFVGVKPSEKRWPKADIYREFNLWLKNWAQTEGWKYLDSWALMLNSEGRPDPSLYERDKLHLNPLGYARLAPLIEPELLAP